MGIFEKAIISGQEILPFIPQRPPMVMVNTYFGKIDDSTFTGFTVTQDSLFCESGYFQETGIIEHFAQSAAVGVGVEFIGKGEEVPVGFIGAVSKFHVVRLPKIGETLHTTTRLINKFLDVSLVYTEGKINEEIVASCELKIFLMQKSVNDK